jgi:aldose 1-epimerase
MQNELFGNMPEGAPIDVYRLKNDFIEGEFISYGAAIVSLCTPDRSGHRENVLLGFPGLDGYVKNNRSNSPTFFGSTIGRYANRIANARFSLNGHAYKLPKNNGQHLLHGGPGGFYNVVWNAEPIENGVAFHYLSKDGDQGFPGALTATVRYTLFGPDLHIAYHASTDKTTVLNLTNHAYFNLAGAGRGSILAHQLKIHAARFTPVDAGTIPTGELRSVAGTPFDFLQPTAVGQRINDCNEQLTLGKGYDHNFVLDDPSANLKPAAELHDPASGRKLEVLTTEPAIQFYSGNYLDGTARGKTGEPYSKHSGLCLETQHYPDSPNQPDFPSTVLRPGEIFQSTTIYRFSAR